MNLYLPRHLFLLSIVIAVAFNAAVAFSQNIAVNPDNPDKDSSSTIIPSAHELITIPASYGKYFTATYLDLTLIYNDVITASVMDLGLPPEQGSQEDKDDEHERKKIEHGASKKEIYDALKSQDSIFSYSYTLGKHFNPDELPKTKELFKKVDDDARLATYIAKRFFARPRPAHNSGYSYPSSHSTRAFLWKALLTELFPEHEEAFLIQAEAKAMNRVILGRHYPKDIHAGAAYGYYLAQEFLNNPDFQKEWEAVKVEIKEHVKS